MIPFVDLKAQYATIKNEIDTAIQNILETSQFILGKEVSAFEEDFAAYCQTKYAVGVNSGTSALHLALLAAGIGPGDEVITVSMTFVATVAAIVYSGAKPVFVDVDPRSYCMDATKIEAVITKRTKAIMPVHLYGQMADMDAIMEIARRYKLHVIEDAAQAHGAEYKGHRAGSMGELGCFSFYPGKNLGAYGEGGAVVTNNPEYNRTIRMLRDWGAERKYQHVLKGYNYRMEGFQGAILRVKLRHLDQWTEARREHAKQYNQALKNLNMKTPEELSYGKHVYYVYGICTPKRDAIQEALQKSEVYTNIHYPFPAHLLQAHNDLGYKAGDFPISEKIANEELSLPLYAELPDTAPAVIAEQIHKLDLG